MNSPMTLFSTHETSSDFLELYSREADLDLDLEADLFDFDTRNEQVSISGPGKEKSISIEDYICIVNKKVESGNKNCNGQKVVGILKAEAKLPPNTSFSVHVSGGTK